MLKQKRSMNDFINRLSFHLNPFIISNLVSQTIPGNLPRCLKKKTGVVIYLLKYIKFSLSSLTFIKR